MLNFQSPKSIQKEEHNSKMIKVQDGSAQTCREHTKRGKYRRVAVGTRRRTRLVLFALPFSGVEGIQKVESTAVSLREHRLATDAIRRF